MDIRYKFAFEKTILLEDAWPMSGHGAVVELLKNDDEVTHIVVTFANQSVDLAPTMVTPDFEGTAAHIVMRDNLRDKARQIVNRFEHFLGIYHAVRINTNNVDVEFIPKTDHERFEMKVFNFSISTSVRKSRATFSTVAQAFMASESTDDPSFVTSFLQLARQASSERRYIDSFRYCFLLFESLYGNGKFKSVQLVDAMMSHREFTDIVMQTINDYMTDTLHQGSVSRALVESRRDSRTMIEYLIDRRGHYFHGNIKRADTWRPDQQEEAEPLSEFTMFLALGVANSMATAMFSPGIGARYFDNAKRFGAIMTILIRYKVRDEHDRVHDMTLEMNTPGKVVTNELALRVQEEFVRWAQTEIHDSNLVSAIAIDKATGTELFHSHYVAPRPTAG
jgi:hypothetical protein